jgi:hypothetical protein
MKTPTDWTEKWLLPSGSNGFLPTAGLPPHEAESNRQANRRNVDGLRRLTLNWSALTILLGWALMLLPRDRAGIFVGLGLAFLGISLFMSGALAVIFAVFWQRGVGASNW